MLYLVGIIITFFLAIILWSKKGNSAADHILAAWLCIIGLHLLLFYWHITKESYNYPDILGIGIPMPLLHGPFLYIYTLSATRSNRFLKTYWLHFIPAALAYVMLLKFFLLTDEEKINVYKNEGAGYEIYTGIIVMASILSGFAYVLFSFYELKKYGKRISEEFSNTEKINLNWLRYLIGGILAIWLIILINGSDALIFSAVVIFVLLLGYFGIQHMGIFTYRQVIVKEIPKAPSEDVMETAQARDPDRSLEKEVPLILQVLKPESDSNKTFSETVQDFRVLSLRPRYERSGLQKEQADKIHQDLERLVQSERVFKKEELTLAQLAKQLGVHPNYLSQVINSYEHKSFYDYINTLRVEEFKSQVLLPENSRYTLLSLAFECGFNSKTAFNRNFKKITGLSPSEYLKEVNVKLVGD
jgi:AraC-like DNA-binding protein